MVDVSTWTCDDVAHWLNEINLGQYKETLCVEHKLDGKSLLALTEWDLRQPPLSMVVLGDIKKLGQCINHLRVSAPPNVPKTLVRYDMSNNNNKQQHQHYSLSSDSVELDSGSTDADDESGLAILIGPSGKVKRNRRSEMWKAIIAFFYGSIGMFTQSFVVVIVNDRMPDQKKFPTLPDLFLDNVPLIPWGFRACETILCILIIILLTITACHKHKYVMVRRYFVLTGTLYFLRSLTMVVTSLPATSPTIICAGKTPGDFFSRLKKATEISFAMGMSLNGVKTCGDYIFSGHTVTATLLNFFITEYTPRRRFYILHIFSWIANLAAIFFILSSHEHYTIDVLIAFIIASRLFMYYHTLANNRSLKLRDKTKWKLWFPIFWFFESSTHGVIPNEYQWPVPGLVDIVDLVKRNIAKSSISKYLDA